MAEKQDGGSIRSLPPNSVPGVHPPLLPPAHALPPLLTWAGRGPRRGAGCRGRWLGPPQTGGRRAAGTAGLPGRPRTGPAGQRRNPGVGGGRCQRAVPLPPTPGCAMLHKSLNVSVPQYKHTGGAPSALIIPAGINPSLGLLSTPPSATTPAQPWSSAGLRTSRGGSFSIVGRPTHVGC